MADDFRNKEDIFANFSFDPSRISNAATENIASNFQMQLSNSLKEINQEAYNNRQKLQQAIGQTASNTETTIVKLQDIIDNQNKYITLLNQQLSTQQRQLEILKSLFVSGENGVAVEKEIMELIRNEIDSTHPLWEYVKDKGGDIVVAGITSGAPIIFTALRNFLASKGIMLP